MIIHQSTVKCDKLYCKFELLWDEWNNAGTLYSCQVDYLGLFTGPPIMFNEVGGRHLKSKTNDDVKAIRQLITYKVNYFPKNLGILFKNLILIDFCGSSLERIDQSDLKEFSKLQYLYLHINNIKIIEKNLFEFNSDLKAIYLQFNPIYFINPHVFNHLNNLNKLTLSNVNCRREFDNANTRSEVLSYIEQINKGDCIKIELSEEYKELKNVHDQVINNVTMLKVANEECELKNQNLSIKTEEMKINLTSVMIVEAENCEITINELRNNNEYFENKFSELKKKILISEQLISEWRDKNHALMEKINEIRNKIDRL